MSNLYSLVLTFLNKFPMTGFTIKATPIIIINPVSVEVLRKCIGNDHNLFNWSYKVHSRKCLWADTHTHTHTHMYTNIMDKTNFNKPVTCWPLASILGLKYYS